MVLSPCDEQAAQGKPRTQEGQDPRNRAGLSDAGREASATAGRNLAPLCSNGGITPKGKHLNSQHKCPALELGQPSPAPFGGVLGLCPHPQVPLSIGDG